MAVEEHDIDKLVEEIIHGAEERYVAELTQALVDDLTAGVFTARDLSALETLARANRWKIDSLMLKYRDVIRKEVIAAATKTLSEGDTRDVMALEAYYGVSAVSGAVSAARTAGKSDAFTEMTHQTARGLSEIIDRQNIALATQAEDLWYKVAGQAIAASNQGLKRHDRIISDAVVQLANVSTIDYKSGISNQIDVAIRRHIVTQISQAGGKMTMARMDWIGHELVLVSAHFGARPTHEIWQGKAYSLNGRQTIDGKTYADFYRATEYGSVAGLKGVNCRHSFGPYFPGATSLPDLNFPAESKHFGTTSAEYYNATQRQRELERRIRKTKREIVCMERAGLGLESPSYVQKRLVLGNQQRMLAGHCRQSKLVRQPKREKAYGVGSQPRALKNHAYWSEGTRKSYSLANLSSFEAMHRGTTGREVGMVFGPNGEDILALDGGPGHGISFSLPKGYKWSEVSVAHTHPDAYGGTFSVKDMYFVTDSRVTSLHAVCREGTYSIAPGARPKAKSLMRAYDRAYQAAIAESVGNADRTSFVRRKIHSWLSENAKNYGFSYTFRGV